MPITFLSTGTDDEERRIAEQEFLASLRRQRRRTVASQTLLNVAGVLVFALIWELLPRTIPGINQLMFPPPSGVIEAFLELCASGELVAHTLASLLRALAGFAFGSCAGIIAGLLVARILPLRHMSDPVLHGLRSIPAIALVPLAIVWFGIGEIAKIALITWAAFFPVWINTFLGARDVHIVLIRSAKSLGASPTRTLFTVILPAAAPLIFAGLRQALAVALVVMVAAELVGASTGLGQLIAMSHQLFRVDVMFVALLTLGAIGFALDRIFATLLHHLFPWYGRS